MFNVGYASSLTFMISKLLYSLLSTKREPLVCWPDCATAAPALQLCILGQKDVFSIPKLFELSHIGSQVRLDAQSNPEKKSLITGYLTLRHLKGL